MVISALSRLFGLGPQRFEVWMSTDERTALENAFALLGEPLNVLEWGSGGSTVHFGKRLTSGSTWLAIEHQAGWAERVREGLKREQVAAQIRVEHVPPSLPFVEGVDDGDEATFKDYVHRPDANATYDVVLVDGRARVACMQWGWQRLSPNGFAALHDAQRAEYSGLSLAGAHLVRLRDPRKQLDGGDIELHFYFKRLDLADALVGTLTTLDPAVSVLRA
jgi:hypothetical protein